MSPLKNIFFPSVRLARLPAVPCLSTGVMLPIYTVKVGSGVHSVRWAHGVISCLSCDMVVYISGFRRNVWGVVAEYRAHGYVVVQYCVAPYPWNNNASISRVFCNCAKVGYFMWQTGGFSSILVLPSLGFNPSDSWMICVWSKSVQILFSCKPTQKLHHLASPKHSK